MDEIEAALNEMILKLKSLCPVLIPSIFPSNRIVESINQLFANNLYIGIKITIIAIITTNLIIITIITNLIIIIIILIIIRKSKEVDR